MRAGNGVTIRRLFDILLHHPLPTLSPSSTSLPKYRERKIAGKRTPTTPSLNLGEAGRGLTNAGNLPRCILYPLKNFHPSLWNVHRPRINRETKRI